jgi:putative ABC transport system substrate-binding protein
VTGLHGSLADSAGNGLRLLKEAVPTVSRVAALRYRIGPLSVQASFDAMAATAKKLGIRLDRAAAQTPDELTSALDAIIRSGANGFVYVQAGAQFGIDPNAARVVNWANAHRLPAVYCYQEYIEGGGLMGYTWDHTEQWGRAAGYINHTNFANPGRNMSNANSDRSGRRWELPSQELETRISAAGRWAGLA